MRGKNGVLKDQRNLIGYAFNYKYFDLMKDEGKDDLEPIATIGNNDTKKKISIDSSTSF